MLRLCELVCKKCERIGWLGGWTGAERDGSTVAQIQQQDGAELRMQIIHAVFLGSREGVHVGREAADGTAGCLGSKVARHGAGS